MTPPRGLAAATVFPGGYGIRPYGRGSASSTTREG